MAKLGICTLRSYIGAQTFESIGLHSRDRRLCFPGIKAHAPAVRFADIEATCARGTPSRATAEAAARPRTRSASARRRAARLRSQRHQDAARERDARRLRAFESSRTRWRSARRSRCAICCSRLPLRDPVRSTRSNRSRSWTAFRDRGDVARRARARSARRSRARQQDRRRSNSGEGGETPRATRAQVDRGRSRSSKSRRALRRRRDVSRERRRNRDQDGAGLEARRRRPDSRPQGDARDRGLRGATPGQALISPPPHHDIYSIEDLAELIYDLRRAAPHARIAVKLVAQSGIGYVASGVAKADADVIHISGHDGGTGRIAALVDQARGLAVGIGLVETHHALLANGLRSRVKLRVDGGFKSGRDVVLATLLGADEYGFGSALLVALGCIYARSATRTRVRSASRPRIRRCAQEIRRHRRRSDRVPRVRRARRAPPAGRARRALARRSCAGVQRPLAPARARRSRACASRSLRDLALARAPQDAAPPVARADASRRSRAAPVGRRAQALAHDPELAISRPIAPSARGSRTISCRAARPASRADARALSRLGGQSFGAFLTGGITLDLDGDANDYVGKSMEGGRIVVRGFGDAIEPVAATPASTARAAARASSAAARASASACATAARNSSSKARAITPAST
jgi:glutamate synthase domain-containing protein 2